MPAVLLHALAQRVEVERLQRPLRFHLVAVMGDEQAAINEMNIGLDAAKAVVQGVEQRAFVLIVIMGMGVNQRRRFGSPARSAHHEKHEPA